MKEVVEIGHYARTNDHASMTQYDMSYDMSDWQVIS